MRSVDIIIIGGGLSGSAVAYGLTRKQAGKILLFDEQLSAQRLSCGNFGLTWFMCKGGSNPAYAQWCRRATHAWPGFAAELEEETGNGAPGAPRMEPSRSDWSRGGQQPGKRSQPAPGCGSCPCRQWPSSAVMFPSCS